MDVKPLFESSLSADRSHLLHLIADVAGGLGFPVYIVGGSVRDLILGRAINDFDITVDGNASELVEFILKKLGGRIIIHSRFGTARWTLTESTLHRLGVPLLKSNDFPVYLDFVSARSETYPGPGSLPLVKRSNIDDDLHRRDFTINAMAIRLDGFHFGELLDPLDGQADIERKLIRVLHHKSFIDDPTRMFRAVRYATRYGFQIETDTHALFNAEARTVLSRLSGERIRHEFDLIFEEENPLIVLTVLDNGFGLTKATHPALEMAQAMSLGYMKNPEPELGEFTVPEILSFRQALGWILYLMPLSADGVNAIAERLAFPALLTKSVHGASTLTKELSSTRNWKPSQWTLHLDELPTLAVYAVWLAFPEEEPLRKYLTTWRNIKPFATGTDLKNRGLEPGPKYKEILSALRTAWLDGEVKTENEESILLKKLLTGPNP